MKYKYHVTSLFIFLLSLSASFAQNSFEGKIKFKITTDGDEMLLDYFIKGDKIRMEMGDNKEAVFIKTEDKSLILMPEEKSYMDLDNSIFSKMPGMMGMNKEESKEEDKDFDINKFRTGKTMTILGYNCEQWIIKDDGEDEDVEAWVTDELGNFMLMKSPMGSGFSPEWSSSVNNKGFFPMLVISREDGEETSRFEAKEVDKKNLDDNLFAPPSDFEEMKIPGMDNLFK